MPFSHNFKTQYEVLLCYTGHRHCQVKISVITSSDSDLLTLCLKWSVTCSKKNIFYQIWHFYNVSFWTYQSAQERHMEIQREDCVIRERDWNKNNYVAKIMSPWDHQRVLRKRRDMWWLRDVDGIAVRLAVHAGLVVLHWNLHKWQHQQYTRYTSNTLATSESLETTQVTTLAIHSLLGSHWNLHKDNTGNTLATGKSLEPTQVTTPAIHSLLKSRWNLRKDNTGNTLATSESLEPTQGQHRQFTRYTGNTLTTSESLETTQVTTPAIHSLLKSRWNLHKDNTGNTLATSESLEPTQGQHWQYTRY